MRDFNKIQTIKYGFSRRLRVLLATARPLGSFIFLKASSHSKAVLVLQATLGFEVPMRPQYH